ncbi:amidohydrolase family protein [Maribacter luteus]|uniref:Amidohydrolase family protein n=1 Tax=Maribacter luteus TaxID=2594478 RepID=A0A6I2MLU5_9FLAO|nr:amidohydrolase family protein [Maribacter luteus]MRX64708.1 amidohydrolase family protein [Maribacter luteus]
MNKVFNLCYAALFMLTSCQDSGILFKDALCIENISIIDPEEGLKNNLTLVIKEGKIFQITPTEEIRLSKKNTIVDGTGKFMIPGLWDAHMHFSYIKEMAPHMFNLFLANGITSVRDTGGDISFVNKWKQLSLANPTDAPRVMVAGPLLDGMPNVYDGSDPGHPPLSEGLRSLDDVRDKVKELDSLEVDFLKAYEMLSPEQFILINKLAKEKGLKVTGHVPLSMDVISASNAGMNSMEHLRNLELSCASNADELLAERNELLTLGKDEKGAALRSKIHNEQRQRAIENYDPEKAKEILAVLAKNDTWQIPTLALSTGFVKRPFTQEKWQEDFKYLPEYIERDWKRNIDLFSKNEITPFRIEYVKWLMNMTLNIHKSGINMMAGTDCPIFFLTPGASLHEELAVLVEAGLTPLQVLKTATVNPAKYFDMEEELGNVRTGHWADLVILDANPLEDIKHTKLIHAVVKQGKYYDRTALDGLLQELSAKEAEIKENL